MTKHVLNDIDLSGILAYQAIHPRLHSSGQLTVDQFSTLRAAGVEVVINIALTNASNSLIHEGLFEDKIVLELGMEYIQLPLLWEQPSAEQAMTILKFVDHLQSQTVWIHCAKNFRVSCLMYLYRMYWMQYQIEQAQPLLEEVWQPNETWTGLMNAVSMQLQANQTI